MLKASGLVIYRLQPVTQFLLLQASYGEYHWSPPKGHVDKGEDEMTTALRETLEESGLDSKHFEIDYEFKRTICYKAHGKPKETTYWLAKLVDNNSEVMLSQEHQAYGWFNLEDSKRYVKFEEMIKVFDEAYNHIVNGQKN